VLDLRLLIYLLIYLLKFNASQPHFY
jgi:hypothetical protein